MEELYKQWVNEFYNIHFDKDYAHDWDLRSCIIGFFVAKGQDPEIAEHIYYEYYAK